MTLLWFVMGAVFVLAVTAWSKARRVAKQLEELKQAYWELRCQHGELRMRVEGSLEEAPERVDVPDQPAGAAFISLASLKR